MKLFSLACLLAAAAMIPAPAQNAQKSDPFTGQWDLVVTPRDSHDKAYPDWMEVGMSEGAPSVRIQPRGGSAFYAKLCKVEGKHLSVQWGSDDTTWDLDLKGGKLVGFEKHGADSFAYLAGVRAPLLKRNPPRSWAAAESIFNGKDLSGWIPTDPTAANHWMVKDSELVNESKGANLKTGRTFDDFRLHIEFNCPDGGNSGIYLRGRYEVQVEYEPGYFGTRVSLPDAGSRPSFPAAMCPALAYLCLPAIYYGRPPSNRWMRRTDNHHGNHGSISSSRCKRRTKLRSVDSSLSPKGSGSKCITSFRMRLTSFSSAIKMARSMLTLSIVQRFELSSKRMYSPSVRSATRSTKR